MKIRRSFTRAKENARMKVFNGLGEFVGRIKFPSSDHISVPGPKAFLGLIFLIIIITWSSLGWIADHSDTKDVRYQAVMCSWAIDSHPIQDRSIFNRTITDPFVRFSNSFSGVTYPQSVYVENYKKLNDRERQRSDRICGPLPVIPDSAHHDNPSVKEKSTRKVEKKKAASNGSPKK